MTRSDIAVEPIAGIRRAARDEATGINFDAPNAPPVNRCRRQRPTRGAAAFCRAPVGSRWPLVAVVLLLLGLGGTADGQPLNSAGTGDAWKLKSDRARAQEMMMQQVLQESTEKLAKARQGLQESPDQVRQREERAKRSEWKNSWPNWLLRMWVLALVGYPLSELDNLTIRRTAKWLMGFVYVLLIAIPVLWGYLWLSGSVANGLPIYVIESTACSALYFVMCGFALFVVTLVGRNAVFAKTADTVAAPVPSPGPREQPVRTACPHCLSRYQFNGFVCGNCGHAVED